MLLLLLACAPKIPAETVPAVITGLTEQRLADGLSWFVLRAGTGREALPGNFAKVHYTGWIEGGTQFDSSYGRGAPFVFEVGGGQVITGWDEGVRGMRVGEKRQLHIPPELGYGASGAGGVIPGGARLVFEVELVGVED